MNIPMLVVDKDIEFSLREQVIWAKQGILTIRVDTMQEAIEKLTKDIFLFVAINADNINYLPMLRIMRGITLSPILIITSHFTLHDQIEAHQHGADGYTPFQDNSDENIKSALALLQRFTERNTLSKETTAYITYGNLFISPAYRQVFYKDKEIELTKMEFDLLYFFVNRRGHALSHEQIYENVCRDENESPVNIDNAICCLVGRLRRKLNVEPDMKDYIQTVRNVGYRFIFK